MADNLFTALVSGGVSIIVTLLGLAFNPIAQRRLQAHKGEIDERLAEQRAHYDGELATLKAGLDEGAAGRKAQRDYE